MATRAERLFIGENDVRPKCRRLLQQLKGVLHPRSLVLFAEKRLVRRHSSE